MYLPSLALEFYVEQYAEVELSSVDLFAALFLTIWLANWEDADLLTPINFVSFFLEPI